MKSRAQHGTLTSNTLSTRTKRRLTAPALEKGLEILALLSSSQAPLTLTAIARELKRTPGEVFRMMPILRERGYVEYKDCEKRYALTQKLLHVGLSAPMVQALRQAAQNSLSVMAHQLGHTSYLAVRCECSFVVVAVEHGEGPYFISMKIGYRSVQPGTAALNTLLAFRSIDFIHHSASEKFFEDQDRSLAHSYRDIRKHGYCEAPASSLSAIVEYAVPIFFRHRAIAALAVAPVPELPTRAKSTRLISEMTKQACKISMRLGKGPADAPGSRQLKR